MRRRCCFDADMVIAWLVVLELTLFAHVALSGSEHVVDVSASDQLPWLIPSLFLLQLVCLLTPALRRRVSATPGPAQDQRVGALDRPFLDRPS